MSYEITEMKEFEMRRDMDILEISISVACVRDRKGEREGKLYDAIQRFYLTFVLKKMVNVATAVPSFREHLF